MKRSKQFVPATETGKAPSDGNGQSIAWQNKGGRNATTEASRRSAGQLAPRPQASRQGLLASSSATAGTQAGMARVKAGPAGAPEGRFLPEQKPPAGLRGSTIGQPDPFSFNPGGPGINAGSPVTKTSASGHPVASNKAKSRKLDAFYGS